MTQTRGSSTYRNNLLSSLSEDDLGLLGPHLEPVDLPKRYVIAEPHQTVRHAYFIDEGLGSVVARSPEGLEIEAGIFGRDGFGPIALILGSEYTPHRCFIQLAGRGHRIESSKLQDAVHASPSLQQLLLRYVGIATIQTSFTALSNSVHPVDERLARWILMCHDRTESDDMALTHEFLSIMLGVRRPTVTTALHVLEGNGFISADRGYVTVKNRLALEQFASDAYGQPEAEYRRLIGPL